MFKVALTGGIASGKTAVSDAFAELGVTIIDADIIARQVVAKGSEGLAQIRTYFGSEVIKPDGSLDRAMLRSIVFEDEAERHWLNQLLHPMIRQRMQQQQLSANSSYSISVIPLLFESKQYSDYDKILVVDCPEETQIKRLMSRDSHTREQAQAILSSQATRQQRLSIANNVIDNSKDLQSIQHQVINLHSNYLKLAQNVKDTNVNEPTDS